MKNAITLFLIITLFHGGLYAQEADQYQYKNAFKISPVEFAYSEFQITYERYFNNRKSSIALMPIVMLKDNGIESKKGIESMLQFRIFLTQVNKGNSKTLFGMHNIGLYTGIYASALIYNEEYRMDYYDEVLGQSKTDIFEKDIKGVEGGAVVGVQFDITPRILLDLYVGGGIKYANTTDTYEDMMQENMPFYYYEQYGIFDKEYTGVKPRLGLQIGFAF